MTAVRLALALAISTAFAALAFAAVTPDQAQAHRSRCHQAHTCPSDHATYRWRGPNRRSHGPLALRPSHRRRAEQDVQPARQVRRPDLLLQAVSGFGDRLEEGAGLEEALGVRPPPGPISTSRRLSCSLHDSQADEQMACA